MSNSVLKAVAGALAIGAAALSVSGTALANTSINATSTGDVFINVVDTKNNTSFIYDTGFSQSAFNTNLTQTFTFTSDANWTSFWNAADTHTWSVVSATKGTTAPITATIYFTSALASLGAVVGNAVSQAQAVVNSFSTGSNGTASSTSNSALLPTAQYWGAALTEGVFSTQLTSQAAGDNTTIGNTMAFYSESSHNLASSSIAATLATLAGTWSMSSTGVAMYTVASSVPLPAPLMLLLSGLGLTGVFGRRKALGVEPAAASA